MTKLQLQHCLAELLPQLAADERARVAAEVAERYRPPTGSRSRWRVVEGVLLTLPNQLRESVVERTDESNEVYSDAAVDHQGRASAVATALNAFEDEFLAPPMAPRA